MITARNPWALIVGRGKLGLGPIIDEIRQGARARQLRVAGFRHVPVPRGVGTDDDDEADADAESGPVGYDLLDLAGGSRRPLARRSATPDLCSYRFADDAFADARRWCGVDCDLVLIEVGRLEAGGGGHWPTVLDALDAERRLVVLSVRPNVLTSIVLELPEPVASLELPADPGEVHGFVADLLDAGAALAAGR